MQLSPRSIAAPVQVHGKVFAAAAPVTVGAKAEREFKNWAWSWRRVAFYELLTYLGLRRWITLGATLTDDLAVMLYLYEHGGIAPHGVSPWC